MALPKFNIKDLMEAGVHYGHNKRRWNPSMREFIFATKDKVHILNLQKTAPMLYRAMLAVREVAARGGKILFVGTKKQAQDIVKEYAELCGQHYVNKKWLGGLFTNWKTVSKSLGKLTAINKQIAEAEALGLTKKEILNLERSRQKLEDVFGGIKEIGGAPDLMVVIDVNREDLAIAEASVLGCPVVGICDTNANIDGIDFPVPGNDDAIKAITLYCDLLSKSVLDGLSEQLKSKKTADKKVEEKDADKAEK